MRKLILIVLVLVSVSTKAQWTIINGKQRFAQGLGIPVKDTGVTMLNDSAQIVLRPNDSALYYKYKGKWQKATGNGGASIDTISLSNRINTKFDSLKRSTDSIFARKNGSWIFQYKDSVGGGSGFVPYTGATQDVDLGINKLSAHSVYITGTNGNGHLHLKHQASDATATGQSTSLYANSNGDLKWKNDGQYYTTLKTQQTADRVYTFENKSYTVGDSADIAVRVKYTDTATFLTPYLRKVDTASLSTRIDARVKYTDTATFLSPYLRKIDTASLSTRIDAKLNITDTTVFQKKSISSYSFSANNTNASANVTTQAFRDTSGTYTGTPTFTGTTAPSGTTNHSFRFVQVGKQVTAWVSLVYATAGSAISAVVMPFPASFPTPALPSGISGANAILSVGSGVIMADATTLPTSSAFSGFLQVNSANNGYQIYVFRTSGSSINTKNIHATIQYYAQ